MGMDPIGGGGVCGEYPPGFHPAEGTKGEPASAGLKDVAYSLTDRIRRAKEQLKALEHELEQERQQKARESWVKPGVIVRRRKGFGSGEHFIVADHNVTQDACKRWGYIYDATRVALIEFHTGGTTTTTRQSVVDNFEPVPSVPTSPPPVVDDGKVNVRLTRDLARRLQHFMGFNVTVPRALSPQVTVHSWVLTAGEMTETQRAVDAGLRTR